MIEILELVYDESCRISLEMELTLYACYYVILVSDSLCPPGLRNNLHYLHSDMMLTSFKWRGLLRVKSLNVCLQMNLILSVRIPMQPV